MRIREVDTLPFEEPDSWDDSTLMVAPVSTAEATAFVARWHYARGGAGNTINVGLYHGMRLVGVAAFQVPISMDAAASVFGRDHSGHVWDLQRFVLVDEAPHNSESWFLSRALRQFKHRVPDAWAVTSFADSTEGHTGTIYQATNALYGGTVSARTQYRDGSGAIRSDRMNGRRVSRVEACSRGWVPVRRGVKHRYVFVLADDRRHRRELFRQLLWGLQPYPKGTA